MHAAGTVNVKIGLEIHVQINTLKTKLFCGCSSNYRGMPPNTNVCPVCLGLPGALPVVNEKAIEKAVMLCLALRGKVASKVRFDRKHYFYPDLPKNYQITQYTEPICRDGLIEYEYKGTSKAVRIRRINLEEDPGRIVYERGDPRTSPFSLIDYNRSGVALLEIVTEPDFKEPEEVESFLEKLRSILEHLEICDCGLEGAFRVDANISVSGGQRVEVKNIGSIEETVKALAYELARQRDLVMKGLAVRRETRHWDPVRKVTLPARTKEYEEDYRYMPDPNLPPIPLTREYIEKLSKALPELPDQRIERMARQYNLTKPLAKVLVSRKKLADFFEEVVHIYPSNPRRTANYLVNDLLNWLKDEGLRGLYSKVKPEYLANLMRLLDEGKISIRQAKELAEHIAKRGIDPARLVAEMGMEKISDESFLSRVVDEVFREYPKAVQDALRSPKAVNFLVGMVMKKTRGRADPSITRRLVEERLEQLRSELEPQT